MLILLDLDGVLVNFDAAICRAHGREGYVPRSWDFYRDDWGMDDETFWSPTLEASFWSELEWTPEGRDILRVCTDAVGEENVYLLTSGRGAGAAGGKSEWVYRELGWPWMSRLLIGHCKYLCAAPDRILVDDADHNIEAFRAHGGRAILVPRPWNAQSAFLDDDLSIADYICYGLYQLGAAP